MSTLSRKFGSRASAVQRLERAFDNASPRSKGLLSNREFRDILDELKIDFESRDDVDALFRLFDVDKSGSISIKETLRAIENDSKGGPKSVDQRRDSDDDDGFKNCSKKLQDELGSMTQVTKRLNEVFSSKVTSGQRISLRDFTSVLDRLNIGLATRETTALFNKLHPDRDDTIDYQDFIDRISSTTK